MRTDIEQRLATVRPLDNARSSLAGGLQSRFRRRDPVLETHGGFFLSVADALLVDLAFSILSIAPRSEGAVQAA